jgi:hypothetical protein
VILTERQRGRWREPAQPAVSAARAAARPGPVLLFPSGVDGRVWGGWWSAGGGGAAGAGSEVAVFEAVGVAFEAEDLGVVDEPVDHRGGGHVVAEDFAPGNCSWHMFAGRG